MRSIRRIYYSTSWLQQSSMLYIKLHSGLMLICFTILCEQCSVNYKVAKSPKDVRPATDKHKVLRGIHVIDGTRNNERRTNKIREQLS